MVLDGKPYTGSCCFDYGNAETSGTDDGNGTMEAIYWGSDTYWSKGVRGGPKAGNAQSGNVTFSSGTAWTKITDPRWRLTTCCPGSRGC